MLTRLKVSGFKNLVDVDVRFGPFTCIAGANGVGKSNLFDAIGLLSALADKPLIEAALSVRDEEGRSGDLRSLFHRVGDRYADEMSFVAEMIVPEEGVDDLGQEAKASITFLKYSLTLAYRGDNGRRSLGSLEITKEELVHITQRDAKAHLLFPHRYAWRKSAVRGRRTSKFISTITKDDGTRVIKLHQDGGSSGRPISRSAANLPRTVLSVSNAAESPTALMARREIQSWKLLQLEPSALRRPSEFTAPSRLGTDGSSLPATLYRLSHDYTVSKEDQAYSQEISAQVYAQAANRLAELIDDVHNVHVERDDKRELFTLQATDRDGTTHPARALSDGTLRFLALVVLELDPEAKGVLCLEEPENGIHPERIPAILNLLQAIATDPDEPVGTENPLRQVIVNTHSPAVVQQVPEKSLMIADLREMIRDGQRFKRVRFGYLPDTWRYRGEDVYVVPKGKLLAYLNPVPVQEMEVQGDGHGPVRSDANLRRVVDRPDLQLLLPFPGNRE